MRTQRQLTGALESRWNHRLHAFPLPRSHRRDLLDWEFACARSLCPLLDPAQHQHMSHEVVGGTESKIGERRRPPALRIGGARAQDQSRAASVDLVQYERPTEVRVRDVRAIRIVQGEQATWRDRRDGEARRPFGAIRHDIADLQALKLGQNVFGAGVVDMPEQLVEAGVGVPAATVVAELRNPGPDGISPARGS